MTRQIRITFFLLSAIFVFWHKKEWSYMCKMFHWTLTKHINHMKIYRRYRSAEKRMSKYLRFICFMAIKDLMLLRIIECKPTENPYTIPTISAITINTQKIPTLLMVSIANKLFSRKMKENMRKWHSVNWNQNEQAIHSAVRDSTDPIYQANAVHLSVHCTTTTIYLSGNYQNFYCRFFLNVVAIRWKRFK